MIPVHERRWIARAVKLGLAGAAVVVVMAWIGFKRGDRDDHTRIRIHERADESGRVATAVGAVDADEPLAPGDMRIYNRDSSVTLLLRGSEVLAGLSPQMRAKITQQVTQSTSDDTAGMGAAIANVVRSTVASAIAHQAVFPLRDIREIEYEHGQIVLVRNNGHRVELLDDVKTDGERISRSFAPEDAARFVEAVRARKRALERR